jgi:hypothetical protein
VRRIALIAAGRFEDDNGCLGVHPFVLLVAGAPVRGIAPDGFEQQLRELFGKDVVITGSAVFRPSGSILRLDAEGIESASDYDKAVFSTLPPPLAAPLDLRTIRTARRGSFIDAIGQWPGDESDAEVEAALRAVS